MAIRKNLLRLLKTLKSNNGFTLIELIVVIAILGILLISLITTFNPLAQYNKAADGTREHDLGQIQRALDTYFNDTGCYPTTLTFGSKWSSGSQVYMEKVPQDLNCAKDPNKCYVYETDTSTSCPQWNVLYASLQSSAIPSQACPLTTRSLCVPSNFSSSNYNYCVTSGGIDCAVIAGFTLPSATGGNSGGSGGNGGGGSSGGNNGGGGNGPITCASGQYYGCTGDNRCNSISPSSQCSQNGGSVFCYCDNHCNQSCQFN
ncbi:MAG TPA: prepilin-type N-terminal cleavage/methylation domain-containing protein [Patescibacteria group bacterium]|nr:prepilin-type N-terminal cleavage/methylation domain-containing protein [Patescibacteria group bacterium]